MNNPEIKHHNNYRPYTQNWAKNNRQNQGVKARENQPTAREVDGMRLGGKGGE